MNEQKMDQSGTQENKPNQNQRTIAEQILISFDAAQKVLIDMKVRSIIIDNPNLLEVLAFFEDAYRVGNFVSGKFSLQSQEKFNLQVEMNK